MTAWQGDPALRADTLARIDRHIASGTLKAGATFWDGTAGSPLGVSAESDDIGVYAARFDIPIALAGLLDPLAARFHEPAEAQHFARAWTLAIRPGADLSLVPTRLVLDLLDAPETRGVAPEIAAPLEALHRRELAGEAVGRREWAPLRAMILKASDQPGSLSRERLLRLCEALCWSAFSSRSILAEGVRNWCYFTDIEPDPDWSEADHRRAWAMLERLAEEQAGNVEAGLWVDYPSLFAAEDASLAQRFEANLRRVNAKGPKRRDALVRMLFSRIAEASLCPAG